MNIQKILVKNLIPYKNNPRINTEAVDKVAKSIQEFGYKVPIVITTDNVIINGHTRRLALMQLGIEEVDCIIANDLSDEEIKAFRLADNKVSEISEWDIEALNKELEELYNISDIDMTDFGFEALMKEVEALEDEINEEIEDDEEQGYYGDERENTYNAYNLHDYDPYRVEGYYQIPMLHETQFVPDRLMGFNYVLSNKEIEKGTAVHFYLDDYQFERIWNRPHFYIEKLKEYDAVLTPDFSLYLDMPMAMKVWNIYRSRLIGQMMQDEGIKVIPTLSWAEEETFDFCFDGIEIGSVISVSTIGVKRFEEGYNVWVNGMNKALEVLKPSCVIVYGGKLEGYDFGDTKVIYMDNEVTKRWKERGQND